MICSAGMTRGEKRAEIYKCTYFVGSLFFSKMSPQSRSYRSTRWKYKKCRYVVRRGLVQKLVSSREERGRHTPITASKLVATVIVEPSVGVSWTIGPQRQ